LLIGAVGAGLVGIGGAALWWTRGGGGSEPNSEAAAWFQKGVEAREQGLPHLYPQAEANFRDAVRADPDFTEAWGALALAYSDSVFIEQGNDQVAAAERARSAALHALRLDPDSLEAQAALLLIPSEFGLWSERQAGLRRLLERRPESDYLDWLLRVKLAYSFSECGRCRDALAVSRTAASAKPLLPATWATHVYCLWAAGELAEAESVSEEKVSRWPSHAELWVLRMALLTFSGRPAEALAFASAGWRPPYINSEGRIERWRATAQALATSRAEDIAQAGRLHLERIGSVHQDMLPAARFFTATGQLDTAFEILEAYYFDRGRYAVQGRPPRTPLTRLNTIALFWPPMAPARLDPRFDRLAEEIGLVRYWRETGSAPDYRQR
jgi:tetratricopeptide (TPR) repeat protein